MQPVRYMIANGFSEFRPNTIYSDVSPYSAMDGTVLNSNDEFPESEDIFLEFSNASGRKKRRKGKTSSRREARQARRSERRSKRDTKQKARADRKERKLAIKEKEAQTQAKVAESVAQGSPEEAALIQQLTQGNQPKAEEQGMSKGLKIGLIVGGVVVLGLVTVLVIRKMRKK